MKDGNDKLVSLSLVHRFFQCNNCSQYNICYTKDHPFAKTVQCPNWDVSAKITQFDEFLKFQEKSS